MGHQIVKQPDGRLAIFSDGVDGGCWLRWDMTVEEVGEYYAQRAADSARESALESARLVADDQARKVYYQFTESFATLNATSKYNGHDVLPGPVDEEQMVELARQDIDYMTENQDAS